MNRFRVRPPSAGDVPAMGGIVDASGLFPGDMLPDLIAPFLDGDRDALWVVVEDEGGDVTGLAYAEAEAMTEGTWNMRAIGVDPSVQGQGAGRVLTHAIEVALREAGHRLLIVDTSGTDAFEGARAFYARLGYDAEARIRDFWADGDDKVTFRKHL